MSQSDIVTLARQGDPDAIATLMNRALRSQNITTKTVRRDQHLYVILTAQELPDRSACVRVVQNGMLRLAATTIQWVTIAGQQLSQDSPTWFETLTLGEMMRSKSDIKTPSPPASPPKKAVKNRKKPDKIRKNKPKFQLPIITFPPLPVPTKILTPLIFAGCVGLAFLPLSQWMIQNYQETLIEWKSQTDRQLKKGYNTVKSVSNTVQSTFNQLPDFPRFTAFSKTSLTSDSTADTTTVDNLNKFSEIALNTIQNPITPDTRIKLKAVGDIIPGTNFPSNKLHPNKTVLFQSVKSALQGSDILFGNFESTLTNYPNTAKNIGRGLVFAFRTPPSYTAILKDAGFDVLSVANNHSFDFHEAGFTDTINNLNNAGMKAVGRKEDIIYHEAKGVRFAFIGFSYFSAHNNMHDLEAATALVKKADENADIVVISVHAGAEGTSALNVRNKTEYFYGENRGNKVLFSHTLIDAGADLILGHGPHVPRALELYKGKLIAYSLGNFMGYRTLSSRGKLGYSLVLEADLDPVGNFTGGKIIPIHINSKGIPYTDNKFRSVGLIRQLTQSNFPNTPLKIESEGRIVIQ
ncbi:MAG: CapA family protein [Microcoleaceae cyanobacterium]